MLFTVRCFLYSEEAIIKTHLRHHDNIGTFWTKRYKKRWLAVPKSHDCYNMLSWCWSTNDKWISWISYFFIVELIDDWEIEKYVEYGHRHFNYKMNNLQIVNYYNKGILKHFDKIEAKKGHCLIKSQFLFKVEDLLLSLEFWFSHAKMSYISNI